MISMMLHQLLIPIDMHRMAIRILVIPIVDLIQEMIMSIIVIIERTMRRSARSKTKEIEWRHISVHLSVRIDHEKMKIPLLLIDEIRRTRSIHPVLMKILHVQIIDEPMIGTIHGKGEGISVLRCSWTSSVFFSFRSRNHRHRRSSGAARERSYTSSSRSSSR